MGTAWVASLAGVMQVGCFASLGVICVYLSYRMGGLTSRGDEGERGFKYLGVVCVYLSYIMGGLTSS